MQITKYGITPVITDEWPLMLSTTGVNNIVSLFPSIDTSGIIEYNGLTLQSANNGFFVLVVDSNGDITTQGNYTSSDVLATELNNFIGDDKIIFIITLGGCNSSDMLDDLMINTLKCNHWKHKDVYSKSREMMHYCGILHGQYGAIRELLSITEPKPIHYQYTSAQNMVSPGYGKFVLVAPDNYGNDSFNGTPRSQYILANATGLITSGTTGYINITFKQDQNIISSEILTLNSLINMYMDVEEYLTVPPNTNNISYSISDNVELVALIIRWSGDVSDDIITKLNIGRHGISDKHIVQNNIPTSLMKKEEYDYFYKNNNISLNPAKNDAYTTDLNSGEKATFNITGILEEYYTGTTDSDLTSLIQYFCCWVKGEVNIIIKSDDNIFCNPSDFSITNNNTTIATSDNNGHWELIEGFIFPEHYTEEQCTDYLKHFKENCFSNDHCNQTVISQTPGEFYFGGKVMSDTQNIYIGIQAISDSAIMYAPILKTSCSMGFTKNGTVSVVNL